jgi:hypothetical protein
MKMNPLRPALAGILVLSLSLAMPPAAAFDPVPASAARQRLHQQQLQDRLALDLQHKLARNRPGLSAADQARLERLELEQRMRQQGLEMEQLADLRRFAHDADPARMRQRGYDQARELQLQRFYGEQQRLLGSLRPAPLEPAPRRSQLRFP